MMKVLVVPQDANPYQSLLYTPISSKVEVCYVASSKWNFLTYPFYLVLARIQGTRILHIHWLYWLSVPIPNKAIARRATFFNGIFFLSLAKLIGYKLVWTVHNMVPHEQQTNNDLKFMQYFSNAVSVKIVHSPSALEQMRQGGLSIDKHVIIPIGPYNDIYPDNITRSKARKILKIANNEFVILFFGFVRPYKGIEDLIKAIERLRLPALRLIIAGRCTDETLADRIYAASKKIKLDFYNDLIPDDQVAQYFRACDVVCLPFRRVTTTSSALLAMSFSKPIVAPRLGTLIDLPNSIGFLYDPKQKDAIEDSLLEAAGNPATLKEFGKNARDYVNTLSWENVANKTYKVYEDTLERLIKESN